MLLLAASTLTQTADLYGKVSLLKLLLFLPWHFCWTFVVGRQVLNPVRLYGLPVCRLLDVSRVPNPQQVKSRKHDDCSCQLWAVLPATGNSGGAVTLCARQLNFGSTSP